MNKKGEVGKELGLIIVVAIALIVGVIFFQVIAQEVGKTTNTVAVANQSLTGVAVNDTAQYITNCRSLSGVIVFNATNDVAVVSTNYTIANNVIHPTTGALTVSITPSALPDAGFAYNVGVWTIDGTCQPLTYIPDSGGRAMVGLITIFFALMVAVIALTPTLRSGVLSLMNK